MEKAKGWNFENCNNCWCQSGKFNNEDYLTEERRLEMNTPYCITREEWKLILSTHFMEDNSTREDSGKDEGSDTLNGSESENCNNSELSDCNSETD